MRIDGMGRGAKVLWGVLALWFALGCASATTTSTPTTAIEASSGTGLGMEAKSATTPKPVGGDRAAPVAIGTPVTPAKDWVVTVVKAELDGTATVAAVDQFSKPKAGMQFLLVTVKVENHAAEPEMIAGNVQLSLLPTSGVAVDSSFSCGIELPDTFKTSAQLQPGAEVTGTLCFEIATADVTPELVLLAEPTFTRDKKDDQRFLAIQ